MDDGRLATAGNPRHPTAELPRVVAGRHAADVPARPTSPKDPNDSAPNTLLLWTYASNVLGTAVFFDRPTVAIWGGVAMGIVIIPWAWRLWSQPAW